MLAPIYPRQIDLYISINARRIFKQNLIVIIQLDTIIIYLLNIYIKDITGSKLY